MSGIEIANHQVEGELIYESSVYSVPQVAACFGAIITCALDHCVIDPVAAISWELVNDLYVFTLIMEDAREWHQTVRIASDGVWMTFNVPEEFSSQSLEERIELRTELVQASIKFGMTKLALIFL